MKIRNGFVSNSSSSSFIVIFPTEPKSVEELKHFLFGKKRKYYNSLYDNNRWTTNEVANTIWQDILDQNKNDFNSIREELNSGHLEIEGESPKYSDFNHNREEYYKARKKYSDNVFKNFVNLRKLKINEINKQEIKEAIYIFSYSDDSEYGCALEHGDLFDKLKHIRISKH